MDMAFGRFFRSVNSSVDISVSFLERLVEKPKNAIRDVLSNLPLDINMEQTFLGPNELPYDVLFSSEFFCPDTFEVNLQLRFFLSQSFAPKAAVNLEYRCYYLIKKLHESKNLPPHQLAAGIHRFYIAIKKKAMALGPKDSNFLMVEFLELVESFICVHGYNVLFSPTTADESLNVSLQDRMRSLYWVTQGFFDTELKLELEAVENLVHDAMIELSQINLHKRIKDKFKCLIRCADKISEALKLSTGSPAGADEFLPALILVVIRANPTMIKSNMEFMQSFSLKFRTSRGDEGYQFTNLCSAIHFIQELNAQKLQISDSIFDMFVAAHTPY